MIKVKEMENNPAIKKDINMAQYDPNLVSVKERTQDDALMKFYNMATITDESKLLLAKRIMHQFIPTGVLFFMLVYWIIGLSHSGL